MGEEFYDEFEGFGHVLTVGALSMRNGVGQGAFLMMRCLRIYDGISRNYVFMWEVSS